MEWNETISCIRIIKLFGLVLEVRTILVLSQIVPQNLKGEKERKKT